MQLFAMFIFGAVTLGAGAMLSPAWPTQQPRMGLAAGFTIALVMGGAVFYAELFGWNTLVVDYLLFVLLIGIFLGGTLSHAQARAEAKGTTMSDAEQGWPGPQDLLFFTLVALGLIFLALLIPLPLGATAPETAYYTMTAKLGRTFDALAPYYAEIKTVYAPGFPALTAYLSEQLKQPISLIHLAVGAVASFMCVWAAYDWGAELRDKRLGRAMAVAMLVGGLLIVANVMSLYGGIVALLFGIGFFIYALRFQRYAHPADMIAGGLMLGATLYAEPMVTIIVLVGYAGWLLMIGLWKMPLNRRTWSGLLAGIPLIALIGVGPWLVKSGARVNFVLSAWTAHLPEMVLLALILPLTFFGGRVVLWVWEKQVRAGWRTTAYVRFYMIGGALATLMLIFIFMHVGLRDGLGLSASFADYSAMVWLRENTPRDVRVLNLPSDLWTASVSERWTAFVPHEGVNDPFLATFWEAPQDYIGRIQQEGIHFVIVPAAMRQMPLDSSALTLVYEQDGARIYQVK